MEADGSRDRSRASTLLGNWFEERVAEGCAKEGRDRGVVSCRGPGGRPPTDDLTHTTRTSLDYGKGAYVVPRSKLPPREAFLRAREIEEARLQKEKEKEIAELAKEERHLATTHRSDFHFVRGEPQPRTYARREAALEPRAEIPDRTTRVRPPKDHYSVAAPINSVQSRDGGCVPPISPPVGHSPFGKCSTFSAPIESYLKGNNRDEDSQLLLTSKDVTLGQGTISLKAAPHPELKGTRNLQEVLRVIRESLVSRLSVFGLTHLRAAIRRSFGGEELIDFDWMVHYLREEGGLTVDSVKDVCLRAVLGVVESPERMKLNAADLLDLLTVPLSAARVRYTQEILASLGLLESSQGALTESASRWFAHVAREDAACWYQEAYGPLEDMTGTEATRTLHEFVSDAGTLIEDDEDFCSFFPVYSEAM